LERISFIIIFAAYLSGKSISSRCIRSTPSDTLEKITRFHTQHLPLLAPPLKLKATRGRRRPGVRLLSNKCAISVQKVCNFCAGIFHKTIDYQCPSAKIKNKKPMCNFVNPFLFQPKSGRGNL
jgi:hypothetical protein